MSIASITSLTSHVSDISENHRPHSWYTLDYSSHRGRKKSYITLIGVPLIPVIGLILLVIFHLRIHVIHFSNIEHLQGHADEISDLNRWLTELQKRRRIFIYASISHLTNITQSFEYDLNFTDSNLIKLRQFLVHIDNNETLIKTIVSQSGVTDQKIITLTKNVYTHFINKAILSLAQGAEHIHSEYLYTEYDVNDPFYMLTSIPSCREAIEWQLLLGQLYQTQGLLTNDDYLYYIANSSLVTECLDKMIISNTQHSNSFSNSDSHLAKKWNNLHKRIILNITNSSQGEAFRWHSLLEHFSSVLDNVTKEQVSSLQQKINVHSSRHVSSIALYVIIIAIQVPIILFVVNNANITATSIQGIVAIFNSRKLELRKEKNKTEILLGEMLPKTIAKKLRMGQNVKAEQFSTVTIMFSDIVHFTVLAAESEPMEIVALLGNIYNLLDAKIECYDVYKVETVGSVYMVVSGLPVRNGDHHVSEIATMALDILQASNDFVIPHLPNRSLQIRIGAHTGPCVAGVVGNKMPRYCLFGDTVNTASRMQSSCLAHRIQVSEATKNALENIGGFEVQHRDCIQIKGKGKMNTYWVLGKKSPGNYKSYRAVDTNMLSVVDI